MSHANMVDEQFELLSLIFRLAGRQEYDHTTTAYQKELSSTFAEHKNHPAVRYAATLPLGYDAVFKFAVHIVKKDDQFVLIDDIASLVEDGRWNRQSATKFLPLMNDFYRKTNFAVFYQSNIPFYEQVTQHFVEQTWSKIDFEWFRTYVDPANLRCIYAPSTTENNYGATVNGTIVYCAVTGSGGAIVHEFCHHFANPIADKWYAENETFRKWCDDSVDLEKMPYYPQGKTMAKEYVTRAYNILYEVEHGWEPGLMLQNQKAKGFPYIEDVYAMITSHEKTPPGDEVDESQ